MQKLDQSIASYFGEPSVGCWASDTFAAAAFRDGDAIRLDIMRHDRNDGVTWDELRAIKNACGFADKDALEFFPRETDVINTGNIRHLYVFDAPLPLIRRKRDA